jgi:hypothetical protein
VTSRAAFVPRAEARWHTDFRFLVGVTSERPTALAKLIGSGALSTDVGAVMPLASVRRAHEMLVVAARASGAMASRASEETGLHRVGSMGG